MTVNKREKLQLVKKIALNNDRIDQLKYEIKHFAEQLLQEVERGSYHQAAQYGQMVAERGFELSALEKEHKKVADLIFWILKEEEEEED